MPSHESTEDIVRHLKENYAEFIDIRYIEKMSADPGSRQKSLIGYGIKR